jgi:alkylated DNA nucleotide flippase Atl1
MKPQRSWKEKLNDAKDLPKVQPIPDRMIPKWGTGTMVLPAPREVDAMMRAVPKGRVTTINEIRSALATKHNATLACPMVTGIFAWIAANAAEESTAARSSARTTPYWRTLKSGGLLNDRYPGGVKKQKQRLLAEGHRIVKKGKHLTVANLEDRLFTFAVR